MEDWYSEENPPPPPARDRSFQLGDIFALGGLVLVILVFFGSGFYLWMNQ